jgi:glycerophosphoryl diester phosphodiesterase
MVHTLRDIHVRYFVVTYYLKQDGQYDEAVNVTTNLSKTAERTANVILDFKERKVVKARMEQPIERNWDLIKDYYGKIYTQIIESLEKSYPPGNDAPNEN